MMVLNPVIKTLSPKKLTGLRRTMSFAENTTHELWKSFMPKRDEIVHAIGASLYSVQLYPKGFFEQFAMETLFEKWAAAEVASFDIISDGMEALDLPAGQYAVFNYKGRPQDGAPFFQKIFTEWLPDSGYVLDARPHFELLGDKYKNNDHDSEEEIWIPVKRNTK